MFNTNQTSSELDNITIGFGISAAVAIIFNTILTIAKEMYPPLLAFMKSVSILGVKHHWLFHGILIVALFFLLGWIFSKIKSFSAINGAFLAKCIAWATVASTLGIVAFFLMELLHLI